MRMLIPTFGSRGDVQPYVNLAVALKPRFDVALASSPCWKSLVEEYGIPFVPVGPDIDIERESARIRATSGLWYLGMLKTFDLVFRVLRASSDDLLGCFRDADALVLSHTNLGAAEAVSLGKPFVSVTLQPLMLRDTGRKETFPSKQIAKLLYSFMVKPYNRVRKKLGLEAIGELEDMLSKDLNLIPVSPLVLPRNPGWAPQHTVTGYWFTPVPEGWTPPADLERFLDAGSPPVVFALGAMSFDTGSERDRVETLVEAASAIGERAVIQGFSETMKTMTLPPNVFHAGSVPHAWLFPRGLCAVHHGGFGTTSSAVASGRPSLVIPHVLDQFLFAQKSEELGVAPRSIPSKKLTPELLAERLSELRENPSYAARAAEVAEEVRGENGTGRAVDLIVEWVGTLLKSGLTNR